MNLKTFHLVESEPHPLVARSLNETLWEKCRIERPVPVHFVPMPRWGGLCADYQDTVDGEVELSESLLSPKKKEQGMSDTLVHVYLHEFSHRLTPGHDHDAAFLAVFALLLLRAGKNGYDNPFLHGLDLYDFHEWQDMPNCQMGEALDWSLEIATKLADTDLSAEAAATKIMAHYEKWKAWKTGRPEREAKAKAAMEAKREANSNLIRELRGDRWRWGFAALFMGFTIAATFLSK